MESLLKKVKTETSGGGLLEVMFEGRWKKINGCSEYRSCYIINVLLKCETIHQKSDFTVNYVIFYSIRDM